MLAVHCLRLCCGRLACTENVETPGGEILPPDKRLEAASTV